MEISHLLCQKIVIPPIGFVYAIRSDAFPHRIKIGKSNNVKNRLSQINVGCAPSPHFLVAVSATFDGTRDEKTAHTFFSNARREGEFFELSDKEVRDYFKLHITAQHQAEMADYLSTSWNLCQVMDTTQKDLKEEDADINNLNLFLSALVKNPSSEEMPASKLFSEYSEFCKNMRKSPKDQCNFGLMIRGVNGISKKRKTAGMVYYVNYAILKQYLECLG
jgi:hypothetical protein